MKDKLITKVHSEQVAPPVEKPLLPAVFLSGEDKRQQFMKEFRELLIKFKAEIMIEDFGSSYNPNEKIVIDFEWDEDLSKKVESGIVEQLVIGRYENGR